MARYDENIFCDCTSDWVIYNVDYQRPTGYGLVCNRCGLFKWYNAYYENMLYDLRSMNQIW